MSQPSTTNLPDQGGDVSAEERLDDRLDAEREARRVKFTPALVNALRVFRANDAVRESNVTTNMPAGSTNDPTVYWQTRSALTAKGYIEAIPERAGWYRLTDEGRRVAGQLA